MGLIALIERRYDRAPAVALDTASSGGNESFIGREAQHGQPPAFDVIGGETEDTGDPLRLPALMRQIALLAADLPRSEPGARGQSIDALLRLEEQLSQILDSASARQAQVQDPQRQTEAIERATDRDASNPHENVSPAVGVRK
jgi:hypothetical protein